MWSANRHPPLDAHSAPAVALRWAMAGLVVAVFVCEVAAQAPPPRARGPEDPPATLLAQVADRPALSRNLSNPRAVTVAIVAAAVLPNLAHGRDALKPAPGTALLPLSLVVRRRVPVEQAIAGDASGAGRPVIDPASVYHPDKVGLEWMPARSTIGLDHGALGLSLDSGYKLSIKSRRGGPMVYVRGKF